MWGWKYSPDSDRSEAGSPWIDPPELLPKGSLVHCFTCKQNVFSKITLKFSHKNHDVSWIDRNGKRI